MADIKTSAMTAEATPVDADKLYLSKDNGGSPLDRSVLLSVLKAYMFAGATPSSVIHSGTGVPSDALGENGDYYIDAANGDYYGPKASDTWTGTFMFNAVGPTGSGVVWRGDWDTDANYSIGDAVRYAAGAVPGIYIATAAVNDTEPDPETSTNWDLYLEDGADGANGSPGYSGDLIAGSGDPDDALDGVDGQVYLNIDSADPGFGDLWGPKVSGSWGASPTGTFHGTDGADGTNGTNGTNGTDGADGADGEDGLGTKQDVSISAGVLTIDYTAGRVVYVTLNANITSIVLNNWPSSGTFGKLSIRFTADGTGRTIAWPSGTKWDGGVGPTPPSTSGHVMWVHLLSADALTTIDALLGAQELS